ncbi:hypothetical protein MBGDF03_00306 [Thermoplasmatales archaeon SCGC AB-540-F20]|nr:hypothetical protein MBGDF03_00306 [Thermoplasmatales archaeon SCGC AB-540-F20]
MTMGKEKFIPIVALVILLIGASSSAYVYASQSETDTDTDTITIYNRRYTIEELFTVVESRTFDTLNYSGVALDDLIIKAGVEYPSYHTYTIIGEDEYQKTVTWENMQNGLLTMDKMTIFSDLPKAFRVRNVLKIEVI